MVPGLTGKSERIVREEDLVSRLGSVDADVLSTPKLIELIEAAAINALQGLIPSDQLSLGTRVEIRHLSATPLGMKVVAHALLKQVDQNRLLFIVDAYAMMRGRRWPKGNTSVSWCPKSGFLRGWRRKGDDAVLIVLGYREEVDLV
ncbi:MAG: hypothetical protein HXY46_15680 [Syntrophaceae bacterium]|nr:hypothetical protein [Syntrophaceae bacterium]